MAAGPGRRSSIADPTWAQWTDKARQDAVIEDFKRRQRGELIGLCDKAGLTEPEMLADEFLLLIEGARVTAQSMGADGLDARLMRMSEALIASHRAASVAS